MLRLRQTVVGVVLGLVCAPAHAEPIEVTRESVERTASGVTSTVGTVIAGLGLDAARYTGWIKSGRFRAVIFDIDFVGGGTATGVTMTCQTSRSTSTANGSGRDMHSLSIAAGTATSTPLTWSYTTGDTKSWTWTVDNIPAPYVNCKFDALASGQSGDTVTVTARGITP